MSIRLLTDEVLAAITHETLARLPDGVRILCQERQVCPWTWDGRLATHPSDPPMIGEHPAPPDGTHTMQLVMTDKVTRAVVAALIVRPWLSRPESWARGPGGAILDSVERAVSAAERFADMRPDQIATLTRLARAALEAT